jgi:large subunit ribosomal protein L29
LFNLRIQKSTAQIEQPLRLRQLRREIARMHTLARERGIAAQRQKGLKA